MSRARIRGRSSAKRWLTLLLGVLAPIAGLSGAPASPGQLPEPAAPLPAKLARALAEVSALRRGGHREQALIRLREVVDGDVLFSLLEECDPVLVEAGIAALIGSAESLGDLVLQRDLREELLESLSARLPPQRGEVLTAKHYLARTLLELRDFRRAKLHLDGLGAVLEQTLPPGHADLWRHRMNVAICLGELGDPAAALALQQRVHAGLVEVGSADDPILVDSRENMAVYLMQLGDFHRARELQEVVLEARERAEPPGSPSLLRARQNLAVMRTRTGDARSALELQLGVLETVAGLVQDGHPELLLAKENVALIFSNLGRVEEAAKLYEEVHRWRQASLSPDHGDLLRIKENLAGLCLVIGQGQRALELQQQVCESLEGSRPPGHFQLLKARQGLALMRLELGQVEEALGDLEAVREAWSEVLPPDHLILFATHASLAHGWAVEGDEERAGAALREAASGQLFRSASMLFDPPRVARTSAESELRLLSSLLGTDATLAGIEHPTCELFSALETLRSASTGISWGSRSALLSPELGPLLDERLGVREALAALIQSPPEGASEAGGLESWRREVVRLAEQRDQVERALAGALASRGAPVRADLCTDIARGLGAGEAWVSFARYERFVDGSARSASFDALLAFVVTPDGSVERVELGPAAELEELSLGWREAIGRPAVHGARSPGVGPGAADGDRGGRPVAGPPEAEQETRLGAELRRRVLDPVLEVARAQVDAPIVRLHMALEDFLYLVPFDALPADGGGRLGDQLELRLEVARGLMADPPAPAPHGGVLIVGAVDYSAEGAAAEFSSAMTPPLISFRERSAPRNAFQPLPSTAVEIEVLASMSRSALGLEPELLTGSAATKAALFERAPEVRFLHVATHGWFASELVDSVAAAPHERGAAALWSAAGEAVGGFAPDALCGLALAGADRGPDWLGRVPGIVTAEELAALDLSRCELAVLSACETNVGLRRAGQGIRSLQTALHAAGARTAVTSLWNVGDEATRELMVAFYTALWRERMGKAPALWRAKQVLREEGRPLRDWAGWVLSGEPD